MRALTNLNVQHIQEQRCNLFIHYTCCTFFFCWQIHPVVRLLDLPLCSTQRGRQHLILKHVKTVQSFVQSFIKEHRQTVFIHPNLYLLDKILRAHWSSIAVDIFFSHMKIIDGLSSTKENPSSPVVLMWWETGKVAADGEPHQITQTIHGQTVPGAVLCKLTLQKNQLTVHSV